MHKAAMEWYPNRLLPALPLRGRAMTQDFLRIAVSSVGRLCVDIPPHRNAEVAFRLPLGGGVGSQRHHHSFTQHHSNSLRLCC
jgi:hypothetical protein